MVGIVDYGVGNLFSLASSFAAIGCEAFVSADPEPLAAASHLVLPGVGAFEDAAYKLRASGLWRVVRDTAQAGRPLLGICLGMQLLFDKSFEFGEHRGLGLVPGSVRPLADDIAPGLKVPHIGWNRLKVLRPDGIFRYFGDGHHVYYVHSFYAKCDEKYVLATSDYSVPVPGMVRNGSVYGAQFHPEKSGAWGLALLRAFAETEGTR